MNLRNLRLHTTRPPFDGVVVDLSAREEIAAGAVLRLFETDAILDAARAAANFDTPWLLLHIDLLDEPPERTAAFVCSLADTVRGEVHVVLSPDSMRAQQVLGHLRRAVALSTR